MHLLPLHKPTTPTHPNTCTATRFATTCLLSLASAIPQALIHPETPIYLTPIIALITHMALIPAFKHLLGLGAQSPSTTYTSGVLTLTTFLGLLTILVHDSIQARMAGEGMAPQWVMHALLSYVAISECEYYRLYLLTQERKPTWRTLPGTLLRAHTDPAYAETRDVFAFIPTTPSSQPSVLDMGKHSTMPMPASLRKLLAISGLLLVWYTSFALLAYVLKRATNPGRGGETLAEWVGLVCGANVIFPVSETWEVGLTLILMRPVRVLNQLLLCSLFNLARRTWARWEEKRMGRIMI